MSAQSFMSPMSLFFSLLVSTYNLPLTINIFNKNPHSVLDYSLSYLNKPKQYDKLICCTHMVLKLISIPLNSIVMCLKYSSSNSNCASHSISEAISKLQKAPTLYTPEQVVLDSSSSLPQSLSPSHSHRRGMQRLFWHLNRSAGHVCWSGGRKQRCKRQPFFLKKTAHCCV